MGSDFGARFTLLVAYESTTVFTRIMPFVRYGNIVQYAKLMLQPHDMVPALPRSEWINIAPDPADISGIKLPGARTTTLRPQPAAAS